MALEEFVQLCNLEQDVGALQGRQLTLLLDSMGARSTTACLFKELAWLAITRCSAQPALPCPCRP